MRFLRLFKVALVTLALFHMVVPIPGFAGDRSARDSVPRIGDVTLGDGGRLSGIVVDGSGRRLADVRVTASQDGRQVSAATSDEQGRFEINAVHGGLCQLTTSETASVLRCWSAKVAPPSAAPSVLLVSDSRIARGQQPIGELLSNPLLIGLIVVAAIAIPVAIHNSRDKSSGS